MRNLVSVVVLLALAALAVPGTTLASTAPPTFGSFTPASGPVGTLVTIHGTNFNQPGLQVTFGGTAASPETVAANKITVRVPALGPSGIILVRTRYGGAPSPSPFRVTKGITTFPRGAWPGEQITIAGSGLAPNRDQTLKLDGHPFGGVATNSNGAFSTIRILPGDLTLGPGHILVAIDSVTQVQVKFHLWLFGNWPQSRSDAEQTGNGDQEFTINTTNVTKLAQRNGLSGVYSPVVEDGGSVFVGTNGAVQELDPWASPNLTLGWGGGTDGPVTQSPAVANGVVYVVTDDTLYAFREHPQSGAIILWTAALGDTAHPFAPVVADGRVYVALGGTAQLKVFDANGVTNCSGTPGVCTPLWFANFQAVFGAPAVDAASAGGSGDVYLSVRNNNSNKVAVRTGNGGVVGSPVSLATTSLSGPALAGGRVFVSGWSAGSSAATLYALDASTQALLWSSSDLGGSAAPTAVAAGSAHTFVQNSDRNLFSFKNAGCGTAVCGPLWSSNSVGSGTTPPTLANGVVYTTASLGSTSLPGTALIAAFDANGCGSSTCSWITRFGIAGINSQIVVIAGTVFAEGGNNLWPFVVY